MQHSQHKKTLGLSFEYSSRFAVLWREGINLVLRRKSKYHIDMKVETTGEEKWRFTGIYGEAQTEEKYKNMGSFRPAPLGDDKSYGVVMCWGFQ